MTKLEIFYKNCGAEKDNEQKPLMDKDGFLKAVKEIQEEINKALKHIRKATLESKLDGSSDIVFPLLESIEILERLVDEK